MISFNIEYLYKPTDFYFKVPNDHTLDLAGHIDNHFLKKYDLYYSEDKPYLINSFEQINWPDPFPREDGFKTKIINPSKNTDFVYKNEFINNPKKSPHTIFIPRPEMMFKMMIYGIQ